MLGQERLEEECWVRSDGRRDAGQPVLMDHPPSSPFRHRIFQPNAATRIMRQHAMTTQSDVTTFWPAVNEAIPHVFCTKTSASFAGRYLAYTARRLP